MQSVLPQRDSLPQNHVFMIVVQGFADAYVNGGGKVDHMGGSIVDIAALENCTARRLL